MLHHPQKCRQIVRNEAHIRLASGTWYVAGTLRWIAFTGLALAAALLLLGTVTLRPTVHMEWRGASRLVGEHFWTVLLPSAVLVVSGYLRRKIDGFFHYQRMREVNWVLETAFTAFRGQQEILRPPFERYGIEAVAEDGVG